MHAHIFNAVAADWQVAYHAILSIIARDKNDLAEYAAKADANQKAVAIRTERLQLISHFVEVTHDLLEAQKEEINESRHAAGALTNCRKDLEMLQLYAKSKGLDPSLTHYMTLRDFF